MKELLKKVTEGQNLTREEAAKAMDMMLEYGNDEVKGRQRQA